jgi:hypothetical protein
MVMLVIHKKKLKSFGDNADFKKYKELMLASISVSISPNIENSRHIWEILDIDVKESAVNKICGVIRN